MLPAIVVIFYACTYYDLQSLGHILQYAFNPMVSSFYQNEAEKRLGFSCPVLDSFRPGACWIYAPPFRGEGMKEQLQLKNHLKEARTQANLSQAQLAEMVGVSRNTISSIETGQFNPTAKLALILCIALDKKFEELFYF